ncbi:MAG TPA: tetratricopeptide repeat protein, partial [bacterium]
MIGRDGVGDAGTRARVRTALPALLAAALVALVAACFLPSLGNEFLPDWDDGYYLIDNPIVRGGLTPQGVWRAFTERHGANWIPLTWLSHMADVSAFGLVAWKHRLVNVALHAANAVLVFALLRRATGALWASALTAAIFAAHPLRVESVVWVAERKDVLSAFFGLLSLLAYLRWVRGRRPAALAACAGLLALSLLAKPMLVTLPVLLLALDLWPLGRLDARTWRRRVIEKLPLAALAAAVAVVTLVTQQRGGAMRAATLAERVLNAVVSYARYLELTLVPAGLSPMYAAVRGGPGLAASAVSLATLALVTVLVVRFGGRFPWLVFGWAWYAVALAPVAGFVPVGAATMADRYTYLPLLGPVAALVWSCRAGVAARPRLARGALAASCLAILALGGLTVRQERIWHDELTLFLYAKDHMPPSAEVEYDLAVFRQKNGDLTAAEEHYRRAIALDPGKAEAMVNLGEILFARGDGDGAVALYRGAIAAKPRLATAWNNLGAALEAAGRDGESIAAFRRAVALDPGYVAAHLNLGGALAARGGEEEARRQFATAARLDPASALARYQFGVALARAGRLAEAVAELSEAAALDPQDVQ